MSGIFIELFRYSSDERLALNCPKTELACPISDGSIPTPNSREMENLLKSVLIEPGEKWYGECMSHIL